MKRLLAEILANAPDSAQTVGERMEQNGLEGVVELPFTPDYSDESEINAAGNTPGNMTNALKDGGWRGGFVTTQAGWIYFSRFTDDYGAIYKMRVDGSSMEKIVDFSCSFLSVAGDWVYFYRKSMEDGGLLRIRTDGSGMQTVVSDIPLCYTISDDAVYYVNPNDPCSVMQCDLDGGNPKETYRTGDVVTAMNVSGDTLIVAYGVSFDKDGLTLSNAIATVDLASGAVTDEWEAATEPLCVGEGCLFYTKDSEGMRWHCLNLETGEDISME